MTGERIASVPAISAGGTFLFRVKPVDAEVEREAILVRTDVGDAAATGGDGDDVAAEDEDRDVFDGDEVGVAAWLNYCQHFTHIKLDKGGGAPIRDGEVLCTNHGAMFEVDTGLCTHGPCGGAYLNGVDVRVEEGEVYLDDPTYSFVGLGPKEGELGDLSSTSNVEF